MTVGPGDLLGWSPMLEQVRLTATAHTVGDSILVKIDAGHPLPYVKFSDAATPRR